MSDAAFDHRVLLNLPHRVRFTRGAFDPANPTLADVLAQGADPKQPRPARLLFFVDSGVLAAQPDLPRRIERYIQAQGPRMVMAGPIQPVSGGEACKNDQALQYRLCRAGHDFKICRQSYFVAIGGGAVLDAVGFSAAISHRGVRLIRFPTTTLSQDDSGVGVKNGINAFGKKNFLGAFAVPYAVINDLAMLETLSDRDWVGGFSEAVKVALIKDPALWERLVDQAERIAARDMEAAAPVIQRSAELHLKHICEGGDPFELTTARPLDFGHWAAHKLESMSMFELPHGEAVGIGLALDVAYSRLAGLLSEELEEEILGVLHRLGLPTHHPLMAQKARLIEGLEEFREHLGGQLTITLLRGVGQGIEAHAIDAALMEQAIDRLAETAMAR